MLFLLEDLLGLACEGLVTSTSVRDFVSNHRDRAKSSKRQNGKSDSAN